MARLYVSFMVAIVCAGCSSHRFTNLGNGVAVPSDAIPTLAREKGISPAEARQQLRRESESARVSEHAEMYGTSVDDARRQLEHARQRRIEAEKRSSR